MSSVDRALLANLLGNAWIALMAIVFTPIYIAYIGAEAYGLIGVFFMLQVLVAMFGLGVGRILTSELIKFRAGTCSAQRVRNLQRSFVYAYAAAALLVSTALIASAPWLSSHWLHLADLKESEVTTALRLASVTIGLRWLCSLYRSMLSATADLVWVNIIGACFATLRSVATAGFAMYISSSIQTYFLIQLALTVCELAVMMLRIERTLPPAPRRARASLAELRPTWRLSVGMTALTSVMLLGTQLDKLMLSRLLSLREFGYYALAATVAGATRMFFYPTSQAHLQFGLYVEQQRHTELFAAFHRTAQLLAVMLIPACTVLWVFADDALVLWRLDPQIAVAIAPTVRWLVLGTMLSGLMMLPHALELAHGRARLLLQVNVVMLILYAPLIWMGLRFFGTAGAAAAWTIINLGHVLVGARFILRTFPRGELRRWYVDDLAKPLLLVTLIVLAIRVLYSEIGVSNQLWRAAVVGVAGIAALAGALSSTTSGRALVSAVRPALRLN